MKKMSAELPFEAKVAVSAEEATAETDIVIMATHSTQPWRAREDNLVVTR